MSTQQHAAQLRGLGLSHRRAALDLGVASSVLSRYLLDGRITPSLGGDFAERLHKYLKAKAAAGASTVEAVPMVGTFYQLGMSLVKMADKTGVDHVTLRRGIYDGRWPDEATKNKIQQWIKRELDLKTEGVMLTKRSLPADVIEFFGLKRDPFNMEMSRADAVFDAREIARAEKAVMNCIESGGWIAVTGPVGSGKTTLIRKIKTRVANMPRHDTVLIEPRTLEKQHLGASHLCDSIIEDLGVAVPSSQRTLEYKARRVARVLEEARRDGKRPALLIDEAHLLRPEALLVLKRLHEVELDYEKLLSIVLVGQESLGKVLKTNYYISEVSQRVDLVELGGLNGSLGLYIQHKIERAGCDRDLFDPSATRAIGRRFSTPLAVNNACSAALIHAHSLREKRVTAEIVDDALGTVSANRE